MKTINELADRPDDWRETMPTWAHMAWWSLRKSVPVFNRYELVSFIPDPTDHWTMENGGYVVIRLADVHVPEEFRTITRYLSRSWT